MFSRVLVANRGEIAVRVIRALHELGIEAVAVYSTADRDALHVRLADRAVCIGPPRRRRELPAHPERSSRPRRRRAARRCTPATGFLAENPAFVRACADNDLVFVGPRAGRDGADGRQGAREGGDARPRACRSCRAPTARRRSPRRGAAAAELGYPVLLKAAAGGGGKGMRLVDGADELEDAYAARRRPRREAAFGDGTLYLEKVVVAGAPRRDPGARATRTAAC